MGRQFAQRFLVAFTILHHISRYSKYLAVELTDIRQQDQNNGRI
jgi:hypothetical protein